METGFIATTLSEFSFWWSNCCELLFSNNVVEHFPLYVMAGAAVGFAVGLTGVGGGSLMTPLLLLFGFPTHIAIGTDLIYAAATKASGVFAHHTQKTIDWNIVFTLGAGSIPASILTTAALSHFFSSPDDYQHLLLTSLGVMLVLTSIVLMFRGKIRQAVSDSPDTGWLSRSRKTLTISMGVVLGICVTLSSVGAGAFGAAVLLVLYPNLSSIRIIGTDIAHAVPLTLIAGLGHLQLGNVDFALLFALLLGSIPAIHVGSRLGKHLPERIMQPTLASILFFIGIKYAFF